MSQWLNLGQLATRAGRLLPTITNLTSWLTQPTTDGTTLANSKGVDAELTDVNCLNLDGIDDEVNTNYNPQGGNLIIEATIKPDSVTNQRTIFGVNGNSGFWFRISNGDWQLYSRNGYIFTVGTGIDPTVGNIYDIRVEYDYSTEDWIAKVKLSTDSTYTTVGSGNRLPPIIEGANAILGQKGSSGYFDGEYYSFKLTEGGNVKVHYPFAEGSGTTAYDISGNGNHGTITGATWTTEDGIESWNHEYGFTPAVRSTDSNGSLNTGVTIDSSDIVLKCRFLWRGDNQNYLFGSYSVTATLRFLFYQNGTQMRLITPNGGYDLATTASIQDKFVDLEITSTTATLNGVTTSIDLTGVSQAASLRLFGNNSGTSNSDCDIHSFSLVKDGTLEVDYVASQGGKFYDKVSGSLVSGTGTLSTNNIPALNTKTKQVATFDGVADYVDTGVSDQLVKKYSVTFTPTEITNGVILGLRISRPACFELMADGSIRTGLFEGEARDNNTGANQTNTTTLVAGTKYTVEVDYDNNEIKINDVVQSTSIVAGRNHTNDNVWIGGRRDSGTLQTPFKGIIHSVKLESATAVLAEYDFQNDIGTTTVQDLTTNDNDGTVTVGSGGLDSFWGQRVADNDGVLVSADYATGNTSISNPAGFVHNNSECGVKLQSRTVGTFDGTADRLDFTAHTTAVGDVFDFEFDLLSNPDGAGGNHRTLLSNQQNKYIGILDNDDGRIFVRGDLTPNTTGTIKVADGMSTLKVTIDSTTQVSVSINGGAAETLSVNFVNVGVNRLMAASTGNTRYVNANVASFSITNSSGNKVVEYNFSEAQGTTTTDLSGNDNNGTLTVGSGGTETFWANSYREYPNVLSSYSFIPSNITVTGLSDANANTTYFLSGYGELISGSGFYWTANNGYFIALDDGGPYWAIYNDIGDELSDNTAAGATLLPAEGSWSNSAVIAHSTQGLFIKTSGTNITQIGQYDEDEVLTATEVTRNERYFG